MLPTIEYTQHTVAWPQTAPNPVKTWEVDTLLVGYNDKSPESGEFSICFMRFSDGSTGVQLSVFGGGLDLIYDERIQHVIRIWRDSDRDNTPPDHFIAWLEAEGAVPSAYHLAGKERSPEEQARLAAMRK